MIMAGRPSLQLAREQWAHRVPCSEWAARTLGQFVSVGEVKNPEGTHRLMDYWTHGEGAAKIGWGTDGSFRRCVALLTKYFPRDPQGLCANLHHKATGEWPTEHGKAGIPS